MGQVVQPPIGRAVVVLSSILWFLGGLAASAALIVVIPPLDLGLLLALLVATITLRFQNGRFDPRATSMLLGAAAFSMYALIWALTLGSSNVSSNTGSGLGRRVQGVHAIPW
jgi:hypothetical protein